MLLKLFEKDPLLLRTLCVLVSLAFLLSVPANASKQPTTSTPDLTAFTLPDGTLPIICFGNGQPDSELGGHCEDCINSPNLPLAMGNALPILFMAQVPVDDVKRNRPLVKRHPINTPPARGPPLS